MSAEALLEKVKDYLCTADNAQMEALEQFLEEENSGKDWWHELPEALQIRLDKSLKQAETQQIVSHEEFKAARRKWFP